MIEVVRRLGGRYSLDLYLLGDARHIQYLKSRADGCNWIQFKPPVSFEHIVPMLSGYDMGFYLLQPTGFNTLFALPNKFFEFIQARLAVAVGPSPEMASIVRKFGLGVVADGFSVEEMVATLERLTPDDVAGMQAAANRAAAELCWEQESLRLRTVFESALGSRGSG
jgi:hypothetical protein